MHRPVAQRPLERRRQDLHRAPSPTAASSSRSDGFEQPDGDASASPCSRAPATDTGSVSASVARSTALSGPMTSTVGGSAVIGPTTKPGAGLAFDRRHDRHLPRRRRLERQRDGRRRHLHDLDAERHAHLLGRQRKQPPAGARAAQIEHRDDVAGRRRGSACPTRRARARRRSPAPRPAARGRPETAAARAARAARARPSLRRTRPSTAARPAPTDSTFSPKCRNGHDAPVIAVTATSRAAACAACCCSTSDRRRARSCIGVEAALDLSVDDDRDAAGLLGHDDRHRVVLLGQADRGAMPRPELLAQLRVHRQRQEAGGRRDAIVLHDDRAVVQRRRRLEDADAADRRSAPRRAGCRLRCSCAARSAARWR